MEVLVNFFDFFSNILVPIFSGFPVVWCLKFWFRKVREAYRKHFHLVAPLKTAVVPSYEQKTKKVNE